MRVWATSGDEKALVQDYLNKMAESVILTPFRRLLYLNEKLQRAENWMMYLNLYGDYSWLFNWRKKLALSWWCHKGHFPFSIIRALEEKRVWWPPFFFVFLDSASLCDLTCKFFWNSHFFQTTDRSEYPWRGLM